jgi:hypothetical protein
LLGERLLPPRSTHLVVPCGSGTLSQQQGGENTTLQIPDEYPRNIVGWLKQKDRSPKLLGSKFIKQAGSDLEDLSPKAEPQEHRGPLFF